MSEICYATGFSSVSYFSRCFRAMYGVSPKQFRTSAPTEGQGLNG
ncbi:MAG: AraC family transcriptional regulator [Prevotella sp.]|nr:AraC family transcriptional regulator [Prevotella sp.]